MCINETVVKFIDRCVACVLECVAVCVAVCRAVCVAVCVAVHVSHQFGRLSKRSQIGVFQCVAVYIAHTFGCRCIKRTQM